MFNDLLIGISSCNCYIKFFRICYTIVCNRCGQCYSNISGLCIRSRHACRTILNCNCRVVTCPCNCRAIYTGCRQCKIFCYRTGITQSQCIFVCRYDTLIGYIIHRSDFLCCQCTVKHLNFCKLSLCRSIAKLSIANKVVVCLCQFADINACINGFTNLCTVLIQGHISAVQNHGSQNPAVLVKVCTLRYTLLILPSGIGNRCGITLKSIIPAIR